MSYRDRSGPDGGARLPLAGVRVLDLSRLVAGNQLTMLLADFGAEVVKVENPVGGDTLRQWLEDGYPYFWNVYGRNKKSIALDLHSAEGAELACRLAVEADILVESFRPGGLERFGLAPEKLWKGNPSLVVARISGWGRTGSMSHLPGFGTLVEAMSGFAVQNGFMDSEPLLPPGALADMVAGTYGAFAALVALRHAATTGTGQVIDVSLFESLFSILGPDATMYERSRIVHRRSGNRSVDTAPRNVYATGDHGWVAVSASTQRMAEQLFIAIGRADMVADPRFSSNEARLRNVEILDSTLAAYFGIRDRDEVVEHLRGLGITIAPVSDISELIDSDYFSSRGILGELNDGDGNALLMHQPVPRLSHSPGTLRHGAPVLDQDRGQVLQEWLGPRETAPRTSRSGAHES